MDFNPRSPHGERPARAASRATAAIFQSTLPARGATAFPCLAARAYSNFNPRSPHGERQLHSTPTPPAGDISIHAPRTGSDKDDDLLRVWLDEISIHAPRTGSDAAFPCLAARAYSNFNPRSPHGERHLQIVVCGGFVPISIHAPRTGSDTGMCGGCRVTVGISIHAPRTGSDLFPAVISCHKYISIHAPSTGSDAERWPLLSGLQYFNPRSPHGERQGAEKRDCREPEDFNPRSPHGERLLAVRVRIHSTQFQSTLPARGATPKCR